LGHPLDVPLLLCCRLTCFRLDKSTAPGGHLQWLFPLLTQTLLLGSWGSHECRLLFAPFHLLLNSSRTLKPPFCKARFELLFPETLLAFGHAPLPLRLFARLRLLGFVAFLFSPSFNVVLDRLICCPSSLPNACPTAFFKSSQKQPAAFQLLPHPLEPDRL
jgi:hypothetical protein